MSQPRNNLEALQHQIPPQQKSTYFAATQSPKPTKFKPAKAITAIVHNGTTQPPSFSNLGSGKENSYNPAPAVPHAHLSNEAIDICSSDSTSPGSTRSIPYKRASSDTGPALPLSPKRQRIAASISDKENAYSVSQKGKAKEGQSPPPHGFYAFAPPSGVQQSVSLQPTKPFATRTVVYNHKVHSDLPDRTTRELQLLYEIDDAHFHQVRRVRDQYRMRKVSNHDPYILDGLLDLLEDRLGAITEAIAAFGDNSEDTALSSTEGLLRAVTPSSCTQSHDFVRDSEILSLIHEHESYPSTSAVAFHRTVTPSTRPHARDFTRDSKISSLIHKDETQIFDEDFVEDDTPISSIVSHGSTLVADTLDHIPGPEKVVDDSAHANTVPELKSPKTSYDIPELNDRQNVRQTISSDNELWNRVDGNTEDDSVEVVSPDAHKPAPSFSAVATLRPSPAEAPSEASLKASPYYPEVVEKLRNVFRLKTFRKNQLAAIISTLDGRDAVVLMPTGGGKSLCYQLPAVCRGGKTRGVTIVVSPLRALMADQVEGLRANRIDVMMLASMDSQDGDSMHELRTAANKPSLVYITPEKLCCSDIMKGILKGLYSRKQLARFVIDEAHLINTWGRDFRSEGYAALYGLRTEYPGVPFVALTATATSEALQDIVTTLGLSDYVLLSQSFNRPNLRYTIIPKKKDVESNIVDFIQGNYPDQTGIIYCIARAKTEEVAMKLRMQGINARHFHAAMATDDKRRIQQQWQSGECKIIVATVAFGMGVDKANVRFVIHFDVPSSIDAYCQETGRAGRDGEVAECILYYSYYDTQRRMLQINKDKDIDEEQKNRKRQALYTVNTFCLNEIDCRRMLILNHFTEAFDPASCNGTCDNCASTGEVTELDLTGSATIFVEMIQELQKECMKITGPLSVHAFRGTSASDMARRGFDTMKNYGKGSDISADLAKRLLDHLVARQILSTELEEAQVPNRAPISYVYVPIICLIPSISLADSTLVQLGPKADAFLSERQSFLLKVRSTKKGAGAPKFKKVAAFTSTSTISVRRKRLRVEAVDDPVEPFSPRDSEPVFDDIEPEAGILEPSTPPLLQARRLRASPSIQVFEEPPKERGLDENQECYQALCALRTQFAVERVCDPQDILVDEILETLSCMLPRDAVTFKEVLMMGPELDADESHDKWVAFGRPFLDVTSKYAMRLRAKSSPSIFTPAELHELFDYQGASSSKPVGER
ncbi:hypothetical protein EDB87DRAFT_1704563 [Lactarius vividus]|nr:hypothetical protein EDB87DRAFT_1704563 [Lactarius vividus]